MQSSAFCFDNSTEWFNFACVEMELSVWSPCSPWILLFFSSKQNFHIEIKMSKDCPNETSLLKTWVRIQWRPDAGQFTYFEVPQVIAGYLHSTVPC